MEPLTFVSAPSRCEYLPDRMWQLRYQMIPDLHPRDYMERLYAGWRRFGPVLFRPECPACRMCQSLRVPVDSFRPNRSQRRAWKRNAADITVRIGIPSVSAEKHDLFSRFHEHGQQVKRWPVDREMNLDLFTRNPFPTEEWTYYAGNRLVAVGYVDSLSGGLSAIYFFHDPAEARRSLGTFNILTIIDAARERQLPYVYLGYYVAGCRSLEYKERFRPNDVMRAEGEWEPFRR